MEKTVEATITVAKKSVDLNQEHWEYCPTDIRVVSHVRQQHVGQPMIKHHETKIVPSGKLT